MENNKVTLGNLYDFNKQIISSQQPLSKKELHKLKPKIQQWFNDNTISGYAMLLCRERYDFTIFHLYEISTGRHPAETATYELIEVLKSRGKIYSIEKDSQTINNAWEIWLKIDNEMYVYYLFCCEDWVIEC